MESMDISSDESSSSCPSEPDEFNLERDNLNASVESKDKYKQLLQETMLTCLIIQDEREEVEHNIKLINDQIEKLKLNLSNGKNGFSFEDDSDDIQFTHHAVFKLREENEIERLKAIENDDKYLNYSRIDLYNVPLNSKPVMNFLEFSLPNQLETFCFNLEGKDINIDKYLKQLFARIESVSMSISINHCIFDEASMKFMMETGMSSLKHLKLLDLSYWKGINVELLADGMPYYKNLTTLVMHHCGLNKEDSKSMSSLFDKIENCIYLDLRYNKLDFEIVVNFLNKLPDLNYLFIKRNSEREHYYVELLRNNEYRGLVDPWDP